MDAGPRVLLAVDTGVSAEAIVRGYDLVRKWQQRALAWRGPEGELDQILLMGRERGLTYDQIAEDVNASIERRLREFPPGGVGWAWYVMAAFGMASETMRALLEDAEDNRRERRRLFPPQTPITENMVRERLRRWEKFGIFSQDKG